MAPGCCTTRPRPIALLAHIWRHCKPLCLLLVLLLLCETVQANPDAKRLYDDLLSNYNRLIRPVSNNTDTVLVKLGLRLSQLIDLVSKINWYNHRSLAGGGMFLIKLKRPRFATFAGKTIRSA